MKLWEQPLARITFYLELGKHKSLPVSLPIPAQPLSHFGPIILKAIGDALSELRKQQKIK